MAIDQALLDRTVGEGLAVLRLYRWHPACLSLGRHEPARRRYDPARIAAYGFDVVRRPTGGRAVLHDQELTYAVAAPLAWFGTVRQAYHAIHAMISEALRALDVPATLAAADRPVAGVGAGPCFASAVGGEVLLDTEKLVGSAQVVQDGALLQHGSILFQDHRALLGLLAVTPKAPEVTGGHPTPPARALLPTSMRETLPAALAEAARTRFGGRWERLDPEPVLHDAASCAGRFRDPAWTWWR